MSTVKNIIQEDAQITLVFNSLDVANFKGNITVTILQNGSGPKARTMDIGLSRNIKDWFTKVREIRDDEGNGTGKFATAYEQFAKRNNIENILGHKFVCQNNDPNYENNPFRVFINQFGKSTLYSITRPNPVVKVEKDPVTGEVIKTMYFTKMNKENKPMYLSKKYYRRLEVRPQLDKQ